MPTVTTQTYEGLFLFPATAATDLQGAVDHLKEILSRAEATIISLRKWDERRLAFEIKGNKRGVYVLVYFSVDTDRLQSIERDCNLSEKLLRSMVIRAGHLTSDHIEAADGQRELADEIVLRSKQDDTQTATRASTVTSGTATATEEAPQASESPAEGVAKPEKPPVEA